MKFADAAAALLDAMDQRASRPTNTGYGAQGIAAEVTSTNPLTIELDTGQSVPEPITPKVTPLSVGQRGVAFPVQQGHDWAFFAHTSEHGLTVGARVFCVPLQGGHDWVAVTDPAPAS